VSKFRENPGTELTWEKVEFWSKYRPFDYRLIWYILEWSMLGGTLGILCSHSKTGQIWSVLMVGLA
jgi:hypothetical protein